MHRRSDWRQGPVEKALGSASINDVLASLLCSVIARSPSEKTLPSTSPQLCSATARSPLEKLLHGSSGLTTMGNPCSLRIDAREMVARPLARSSLSMVDDHRPSPLQPDRVCTYKETPQRPLLHPDQRPWEERLGSPFGTDRCSPNDPSPRSVSPLHGRIDSHRCSTSHPIGSHGWLQGPPSAIIIDRLRLG